MAEKPKQKVRVNIPKLIDIYNTNHPEKPVNNNEIAKMAGTTYQTLGNMNIGKTGKGMNVLHKLLEISGATYEEVTEKI